MEDMRSLCSLLRWKKITIPQFKRHKKNRLVTCGLFAIIVFTSVLFTVQSIEAKKASEVGIAFAAPAGMFFVGEELVYEVSYSIFALGSVRLQILDTIAKDGVTLYQAKAFMDSYGAVPFVNLHYVFYSEIDRACYSHFFSGLDTKDPHSTSYSDYVFDYLNKQVSYEKGIRQQHAGSTKGADTISAVYQDGLSLFYYARANVHSSKAEFVPTFVNEQKVATYINFMDKKTSCEIDAVEYPIDTIEFDGRAEFVGIFGLTGGFSGWFSNDEAAIPIVAKMKVILGSVRVELKRWNRPGWVPPRAVGQ